MDVTFPNDSNRFPEAYVLDAKAEGFKLDGPRTVLLPKSYDWRFWDLPWKLLKWRVQKWGGYNEQTPSVKTTPALLNLGFNKTEDANGNEAVDQNEIRGTIGFEDAGARRVYNVTIRRSEATEEPAAESTEGSESQEYTENKIEDGKTTEESSK